MRPSLLKRLERFNSALNLLEELSKVRRDEFLKDIKLQSIAERNLQIAVEFVIDLCNMLISDLDLKFPETYKEAIVILQEAKIIEPKLSKKLQQLVGLRNIIVHMYADVRAEIIYDNLADFCETLREAARVLIEYLREVKET